MYPPKMSNEFVDFRSNISQLTALSRLSLDPRTQGMRSEIHFEFTTANNPGKAAELGSASWMLEEYGMTTSNRGSVELRLAMSIRYLTRQASVGELNPCLAPLGCGLLRNLLSVVLITGRWLF